ncbi:MAG: signal peptide peptidase SppA [Deltaproteobacteria bacterium]|nr:MAG: signal peptide peptidase SppA [Deltaproteobacteria bacterium]
MKKLLKFIFNIFKWAGKSVTILRNLIINLVFFGSIIILAAALMLSTKKVQEPVLTANTGLILSLAGQVVEEKENIDPFNDLFNEAMGVENPYQEILLQDILDAVNHAAIDSNISYLLLDMERLNGIGLPQMEAIGQALDNFKKSGKKVLAAEDYYRQDQYYLASYASEIILNPMGKVDLHGFGLYRLYFREALDRLKVNYHIFRVGTHKSAIEPLIRDDMSPEDKEQNNRLLAALWSDYTAKITSMRRLAADALDDYANHLPENLAQTGGDTARLALDKGLVDKLMTRVELEKYLNTLSERDEKGRGKTIKMKKYLTTFTRKYTEKENSNIGLIVAQGMILPGEQPPGTIGGDTLAKTIRKARQDKAIKAVVLRIDSGGGSAFASEIIRQELLALKDAGKKVVVSMGNTAASGGYWIASAADEIWASPTTITGSIGIFGAIPTFEGSLASLGVYGDGVGTTAISSGIGITRPLSDELEKTIQLSVEHGYNTFIDIVAEGRNMPPERVEELAGGRIYDGVQAKQLGLVDYNGGLEDAVRSAAKLAGIEKKYKAVYIRKPLTMKEKILQQFSSSLAALLPERHSDSVLSLIHRAIAPAREVLLLKDPHGVYARSLAADELARGAIR